MALEESARKLKRAAEREVATGKDATAETRREDDKLRRQSDTESAEAHPHVTHPKHNKGLPPASGER